MPKKRLQLIDVLNADRKVIELITSRLEALRLALLKKGLVTEPELDAAEKENAAEAAVEFTLRPELREIALEELYGEQHPGPPKKKRRRRK